MNQYLYFLRHATAEVIRPNQLDIDRCLIEKGRLQARRVAQFMLRHQIAPLRVFSSPYPRAMQTAAILCKEAQLPSAIEQDWLALGTDTELAQQQLTPLLAEPTLVQQHTLFIGHEPDFSQLISALLGLSSPQLNIKKASLTCLAYCYSNNSFELQWSIPAKFM